MGSGLPPTQLQEDLFALQSELTVPHGVVQCPTCAAVQGGPERVRHWHWRPAEEQTSPSQRQEALSALPQTPPLSWEEAKRREGLLGS